MDESVVISGKLGELWTRHIQKRVSLTKPAREWMAEWFAGDHALTGKNLDKAKDLLETYGMLAAAEPGLAADIRAVPVDGIFVGKRFREVNEAKAMSLATSLQESGQLLQAIGVTSDLHLVFGAHRLRAAKILGWTEIAARFMPYDSTDDRALLDELDENLRRSELSALELSQAMAARKDVYERLRPAARRGAKGGRPAQRTRSGTGTPDMEALEPNAVTATAERTETPIATKYLRPDGKIVEVFKGLGKAGWMAGIQSGKGGWHRVKSPQLEAAKTQQAAQKKLDAYAGSKGWEPVRAKLNDTVSVSLAKHVASFAEDAAEKTGKSERTIQRAVKIGANIPKDVAAKIADTPVANKPNELAKLARLEPDMQRSVAALIADGECKTVTEALAEPEAEREPVQEASEVLRGMCDKMASAWRSSCGAAATAQLGAAVLESVAEEWIRQQWSAPAKPSARRKPR